MLVNSNISASSLPPYFLIDLTKLPFLLATNITLFVSMEGKLEKINIA
jgi:hypothetical protein|nr:MAG TPA: hypothetical protein [Caudoviricetes sp.]